MKAIMFNWRDLAIINTCLEKAKRCMDSPYIENEEIKEIQEQILGYLTTSIITETEEKEDNLPF